MIRGIRPKGTRGGLQQHTEGMGDGLAEWIITTPDGVQLLLQMAYFGGDRQPVLTEFGPVLDLDDAIGGNPCSHRR